MYSNSTSTTNSSNKPFGNLSNWSQTTSGRIYYQTRYPDREMWEKKRVQSRPPPPSGQPARVRPFSPYSIRYKNGPCVVSGESTDSDSDWEPTVFSIPTFIRHTKFGSDAMPALPWSRDPRKPGYLFDHGGPRGSGFYLVDRKLAIETREAEAKSELLDEEEEEFDEDYEEEEEELDEEELEEEVSEQELYPNQRLNNELIAAKAERDALLALKKQKELRTQLDEEVEAMREILQKKKQKNERMQKKIETKEKELKKLEKKQELEQAREELCRLKALKASTVGSIYPQAPKKTSQPPKLRMKKRKLKFEEDSEATKLKMEDKLSRGLPSTHRYNLRSRI